jgi:TatD DNase family protein
LILTDSHCHLDRYHNEQFDEVFDLAIKAEVGFILTMGTSIEGSWKIIDMAQRFEQIYAAVGIHPFLSVYPTDEVKRGLQELTQQKRVVAMGEVGLDYFRKPETAEVQKELLLYEVALARQMDLPVSIHCRDAYQDTMTILRNEARLGLKGWIHSFFSGPDELQEWLDLGFYISPGFMGVVHSADDRLHEAICAIPEDRLLIETDCANTKDAAGPYEVALVAQKIAALRGTTIDHVAEITTANLKRLLKISD